MNQQAETTYSMGIDVGSTTVKVVVLDGENRVRFAQYRRHMANIRQAVRAMLAEVDQSLGDIRCTLGVTGSGGLNLSKALHTDFVQEVVAGTTAIRQLAPETDVIIELGGEDAKIVFLRNGVEQRMNGVCAGGTGAFIDQMAALLQTDAAGLNEYAKEYKALYPIAARCGVFAKSDIQPLINDGVSRADISASIFQAVVNQTIAGLACGRKIRGAVAFLGGPLYFLSELRNAFIRTLRLQEHEVIFPENSHLVTARGAALMGRRSPETTLSQVRSALETGRELAVETRRLEPLFRDRGEYEAFAARQGQHRVVRGDLATYRGNCFLGVDAGSTTTKLVLISDRGELLYSFYSSNRGDPLAVLKDAFREIRDRIGPETRIAWSCSTGYGETLIRDACRLDEGEVETIAHAYGARFFSPGVDCILDIGGQDMKCIRLKDGAVDTIILNEACSSGCGSFIENFANSLGYSAEAFAKLALFAARPIDLGTRCTVFMNSNVKQAQKEGAAVEDIAAGLAYSVIKNTLFKVIKLTDAASLGENVVVQGGTFHNDAVLRALEKISGQEVVRPDIAGLMGAFGAALIARERWAGRESQMLAPQQVIDLQCQTEVTHCKGCQNQCRLTVSRFDHGRRHVSGNRCEKGQGLEKRQADEAPNLFAYKRERLFSYEPLPAAAARRGEIGMPRALNIYENYPFWAVFFRELGFRVLLSPPSSQKTFQLGMETIPSESECYPAKLTHGHIQWLIDQGVQTIFYPCIFYERQEDRRAQNHFNCPMVISYPECIKNNVDDLARKNIRYIDPFLAFSDEKTLVRGLCRVMAEEFQIPGAEVRSAAHLAWQEWVRFKEDVAAAGKAALDWLETNHRQGVVLAGRPYHLDPEINHGIPEMINGYGLAVLTEDSVSGLVETGRRLRVTNQWVYHARLYAAAELVTRRDDLELIQLNSFGCGLDAVTIDQVQELLVQSGKLYTLLKIDEVSNLGAARIRVRSLLAAGQMRKSLAAAQRPPVRDYQRKLYTAKMQRQGYTILATNMSPGHFDFLEAAFQNAGYRVELLRNEGPGVTDMGLKYVNNDACYPAMIVTGQIIDAIRSGRYDVDRLAVMMTQTGGGCRASNYVAFIRKALQDAGYPQVPVISLNANRMETNPGFKITGKMLVKAFQAVVYGDVLLRMLRRMRPYERVAGSANRLYEKWRAVCLREIRRPRVCLERFYRTCEQMIADFDRLPIDESRRKPRVGVVGEILVKYMPFSNNYLADLLEREGAEVVLPDLWGFLEHSLPNLLFRAKYLGDAKAKAVAAKLGLWAARTFRGRIDRALDRSRHFQQGDSILEVCSSAQEVLQTGNQCGEGWLLGGEIIDMLHKGVDNIVCVQPFACLPNHIVGKGVIKRIKELYPQANIVAIDYDPSASQVNQLNRIKLMLEVSGA